MKPFIFSCMTFVVLFTNVFAENYTEKTFLMSQPLRIPTERILSSYQNYLVRQGEEREGIRKNHLFGTTFQFTGFYRESFNKRDLGQYFGYACDNVISIGTAYTDFQSSNLVHNSASSSALDIKGNVKLSPYQRSLGMHFAYLQRIPFLGRKFYVSFNVPFVHLEQGVCLRDRTSQIATVEGTQKKLRDYFSGNLLQANNPNKQAALQYAKIDGMHGKTAVADIDASFGYQFSKNDMYYVHTALLASIPTGNKSCGNYLFEPIIGHGGQLGIGCSVEAMVKLYEGKHTSVDFTSAYFIKSFFSNIQKRTLGFRSGNMASIRSWSQYLMLGEQGKIGVFPAANVLTRDVRVRTGLEFTCYLGANFYYRNFALNLGYNGFSRSDETVYIKNWTDDIYALADSSYDTSNPFSINPTPNPGVTDNSDKAISSKMLVPAIAATPASISHKIYGLMSYLFNKRGRIPVSVGLGGAVEVSQGNSAVSAAELYGKLAVSF